jgi:hypothetical protein
MCHYQIRLVRRRNAANQPDRSYPLEVELFALDDYIFESGIS